MKPAAVVIAALVLAACSGGGSDAWRGYVEGEFVLLASPYAGQLQELAVKRGDAVQAGQPVFVLEQENERAQRLEAEERLRSAQARLVNLDMARRLPEIEAQRGELSQALAARELSALQLAQQEKLFKSGFNSQARVDEARAAYERDVARVKAAEANLRNLQLPLGRDAERKAAEGDVRAAQAVLDQAAWRQSQKSVSASASGFVQDTFFVQGEWVPAGRPVASILPPGNVKVRFYVPETVLGALAIGQPVQVRCDGCAAPIDARITYISRQAEYTPPVLYSRDSRGKLVFLVEARPASADGTKLHPGQPVDVARR